MAGPFALSAARSSAEPFSLSVPVAPFVRALAARARVEPPLRVLPFREPAAARARLRWELERDDPFREAVARAAAVVFCDRFAPFREPVPARAVFAFDPEAVPVVVRFFADPVPDAAFDADARERVAVLLRVPPLDRFVVAIGSSKRVTPGASVLPTHRWF